MGEHASVAAPIGGVTDEIPAECPLIRPFIDWIDGSNRGLAADY
jgi:hypothetical protein